MSDDDKPTPEPQPKDQRIPIMMSAAEVQAIDDWRFENRVGSRSEAIRRLNQLGIAIDRRGPVLMRDLMEAVKEIPKQPYDPSLVAKPVVRAMVIIGEEIARIRSIKGFGSEEIALIKSLSRAFDQFIDVTEKMSAAELADFMDKVSPWRENYEEKGGELTSSKDSETKTGGS